MSKESRYREWIIRSFIVAGIAAVITSAAIPFWKIKVVAPQYPKGLSMTIYIDKLAGDVQELDTLNHYIGMRRIEDAAKTERRLAIPGLAVIVGGLLIAAFLERRWSAIFVIPAVVFPFIFATDLYFWLRDSGLNLDPHAPLSSSIKPFIPPLFGEGKIGQFKAHAGFENGFYAALAAALITFIAGLFRAAKKNKPAFLSLFFFICFALSRSSEIWATSQIVSSDGPYPSIAQAVDSAANGDTIIVRGGTYQGPLIISKSIHLIGENQPVLDGGGKKTTVILKAPDILIRGFIIRNSGNVLSSDDAGLLAQAPRARIEENEFIDVLFGVDLKMAPGSIVRKNVFKGKALDVARRGDLIRTWYSDRVVIENNVTMDGRDAVLWFSRDVVVKGNTFLRGRYGLHFMYCNGAIVDDNRVEDNSVGIYLMYSAKIHMRHNQIFHNRGPSGYGIGFKDMEEAMIEENWVVDNRVGFFIDHGSGLHRKNVIAYNDVGIQMLPTASSNHFETNSMIDNGEQVVIDSMGAGFSGHQWSGNYWSDYRGYDADQDGIGDAAYQSIKFFERLTDRFSGLKIFALNPSVQALDFAAAAFPVFSPRPRFTDSAPLMKPVFPPLAARAKSFSIPWILVSAFLMLPALTFHRSILNAAWAIPESPASGMFPMVSAVSAGGGVRPAWEENVSLRVTELGKKFGKLEALKNISFEVKKGETVVLWGPNGAGKTTVLRCLLGTIPFDGTAEILGMDVARFGKAVRNAIGYVPQEIRLHTDQTVYETVSFYAALRRVSRDKAEKLIQRWGLADSRDRVVNHLSGGMKQKLALIVALLSDPSVLFLDESTSHLDLKARHEFAVLLSHLKKEGKTLLICSHHASEVWKIADRVIVLEKGKKVREGAPEAVRKYLGGATVLFLTLAENQCARAAKIMADNGFPAEHNRVHLLVKVPSDKKTEPLRLLSDAGIPVLDFDLENEKEHQDIES